MNGNSTPLVLLPGTVADERVFAPVMERLKLDAMSIGMSGARSAAGMAKLVLERAPERFSLWGFSLGAIVALEVVAQAPERVERLALFGCNARAIPADKAAARRATVPVAERDGITSYIDNVWEPSVPLHRRGDDALRTELHAMAADTPWQSFIDQIEMAIDRVDSRRRLHLIDMPVLAACGAEDRVCPPELSREIADAIPGATLAVVDRAGHYLMLDQPDIVARLLADWLATPAQSQDTVSKEFS